MKQNTQDVKKKQKSNLKKSQKKSSAVSLTKVYERNRSANEHRKKQTKSVSPSRDLKDYRSGPIDKKNYLSNNITSKTRQVIPSRSQKSLTDRQKNQPKPTITVNPNKKQEKGDSKSFKKQTIKDKNKKLKNQSKVSLNIKKNQHLQKTQCIAKQFDSILKSKKTNSKKSTKKNKQEKTKKSKSKQKKIIVSHNNSKNFISKNKLNSDFSNNSHESPQRAILSTRYQQTKINSKRTRLSFQPSRKKGKSKEKAKTQALSPQKTLENKNQAAVIIQKVFRGYLTRKYIAQFKKILLSVITIQRFWRGFRDRKLVKQMKIQKNKIKKEQMKLSKQKFSLLLQKEKKNESLQQGNQLASLLQQILNQQNINQSIKSKISTFLKKEQNIISGRSSSAKSHLELEMKSQKRFFQQIDKKKYKFGSPLIKYSPKLQKSDLSKSPQIMIQNLITIKQFQKEKLINNAKLQIEGLQNLTIRNIFSPRTRDIKKIQINKKLQQDLLKFDQSISEVIKSCKQSQDIVGPIKPFSGHSTPQNKHDIIQLAYKDRNQIQNDSSPRMSKIQGLQQVQKLNSSQKKLQDLSMQLLQYYEQKTQIKAERQYQKLDPSYQFIEQYLFSLFQFLRQSGRQYRQSFINIMRTNRNLQIKSFLQNLNLLTEDSDQDFSFKLPMYKYLQRQQPQVIQRKVAEQFNNSFLKLQRHQLGLRANIQDIYLKMILDALNQALNLERPYNYIFTETSIAGRSNRMRILEIQALDGFENDQNQSEFSFYFANSMNHLYKWAHTQCGKIPSEQNNDELQLVQLNQTSMKQYLKFQTQKQQFYYDQLLQVVVALSNQIFDQIIVQEGVGLYMIGQ